MLVCACVRACVRACARERHIPDDLLGEAAVDVVDVILQRGAGLRFDLLELLQTPAGHKQPASLAVMREHLRGE